MRTHCLKSFYFEEQHPMFLELPPEPSDLRQQLAVPASQTLQVHCQQPQVLQQVEKVSHQKLPGPSVSTSGGSFSFSMF
jgi:hypothetical protein